MERKNLNKLINKLSIFIPDRALLKVKYKYHTGKNLNLFQPKKYTEKLQWLKLYNRKTEYTNYVDKFEVRAFISKTIGEKYLIPLIGCYDNVNEIKWDDLPNKFVLKCTHGSHCNIICEDKSKLDIQKSKKQLKKWMKRNWFWYGREWPYKNVKPRIICEEFMVDESGVELKDYKFLCFNGEPKVIQVDYDRFSNHKRNLYDIKWNYIPVSFLVPSDKGVNIKKPEKLAEMLNLAKILSKDHPHLRVDFYSIENNIYFGEMTFYPESGFGKFSPEEYDSKMGKLITLI